MQFIISHWEEGTSARCGVIKTHHSEIQTPADPHRQRRLPNLFYGPRLRC